MFWEMGLKTSEMVFLLKWVFRRHRPAELVCGKAQRSCAERRVAKKNRVSETEGVFAMGESKNIDL